MKRRDFLKALGVGTVTLAVQSRIRASQPSNNKPNIIFIMADDLGYQELGCYGQQKIKTPHVDRLSAEGMRFMQYYTGSAEET